MEEENKMLENEGLEGNPDEMDVGDEAESQSLDGEESAETVPLPTFLELKRQNKLLKKQLNESKQKDLSNDMLKFQKELESNYIDLGIEEDVAKKLAADFATLKGEKETSYLLNDVNSDIDDLMTEDFFSDADLYRKDIYNTIKSYKDRGIDLDVEGAYVLVTKGKNKTVKAKEVNRNSQQRQIIQNKQSGKNTRTNNVANSQGTPPKAKYTLDEHDRKALKQLQEWQPDAGWTEEKYFKSQNPDHKD